MAEGLIDTAVSPLFRDLNQHGALVTIKIFGAQTDWKDDYLATRIRQAAHPVGRWVFGRYA